MPKQKEVSGPEHLTRAELERFKGDLIRELQHDKTLDRQEKEELREQIRQANDWIEERKKADADRDKVKGDSTTMVIPPGNLVPTDKAETQPTTDANQPDATPNKRKLRLW